MYAGTKQFSWMGLSRTETEFVVAEMVRDDNETSPVDKSKKENRASILRDAKRLLDALNSDDDRTPVKQQKPINSGRENVEESEKVGDDSAAESQNELNPAVESEATPEPESNEINAAETVPAAEETVVAAEENVTEVKEENAAQSEVEAVESENVRQQETPEASVPEAEREVSGGAAVQTPEVASE